MTLQTKAAVKTSFEQGDRPSQTECADWIDSTLFYQPALQGLYQVQSTASSTSLAYSTLGLRILGSETRNTARGFLNLPSVGTAGADVMRATSALAALSALGIVSAGQLIVQTSATASAWNALAITSAGKTFAETTATAQLSAPLGFIGHDVDSILVTAYNFGTDPVSAATPASSAFIIALPSAASQTAGIEIWLQKLTLRANIFHNHDLNMQMRRPGNSAFDAGDTDYKSTQRTVFTAAAVYVSSSETSSATIISDVPATTGGNENAGGSFGLIRLNNWNNPNQFTTIDFTGGYVANKSVPMVHVHSMGVHQTASRIDAVRLAFVSSSVVYAKISVILAS